MSLLLVLALFQAPFLHEHEHAKNAGHASGFFMHAHLSQIQSAHLQPEWRDDDPDEDARFQKWFAAVASDSTIPLFLPAATYTAVADLTTKPHLDRIISSGHDPPSRVASAPRSPPL